MKEDIERIIKETTERRNVDKSKLKILCHPKLVPILEEVGIKRIKTSPHVPLDIIIIMTTSSIKSAIEHYLTTRRN